MTIKTFEDIVAWQKGRDLYISLHGLFQNSRDYSYRDQLLRAALSISNNIAEGFDRGSKKELKQFLIIARGSAAEVRSMLSIAKDLGLISSEDVGIYQKEVKDISKLLTGFIKSLKVTDSAKTDDR